jgi:hypothetical protein
MAARSQHSRKAHFTEVSALDWRANELLFLSLTCPAATAAANQPSQALEQRCETRARCKARLLVLTPIAKPMNRFAACGDPRAERGARNRKDDQGRNGRVVRIGPGGLAA